MLYGGLLRLDVSAWLSLSIATLAGAMLSVFAATFWRRLAIAAGFPLSLLISGSVALRAANDGLDAEQLEVPREVEDEAVAIVDDDDHPPPPIPQASSTRSMPSALWSDSACSADGSLAAVIPPPAAKAIEPGETTSVRIRRLKSAVPSKAT